MYNLYLRPSQRAALALHQGLALNVDPASFSVTTEDVTLRYSSPGEIEPASYAITTYDVILARDPIVMSVSPAAFSVTAPDMSMVKGRNLLFWRGVFFALAHDVTLFYVPANTLNAEAGAFNITTSDVSFERTRMLLVSPQSFSITGYPVTMLKTGVLSVESGSYSLAAVPATLLRGLKFRIEPGEYAVTCADVSFLLSHVMVIDPASFVIEMFPVVNGDAIDYESDCLFVKTLAKQSFVWIGS